MSTLISGSLTIASMKSLNKYVSIALTIESIVDHFIYEKYGTTLCSCLHCYVEIKINQIVFCVS